MDKVNIDKLIATLPGASVLTPLDLNEMRFSGKKTVLTPKNLKRLKAKRDK